MKYHLCMVVMLALVPNLASAAVKRDPNYRFTAPVALPEVSKLLPQDRHAPVTMESDTIGYDNEHGIVIARGNVQVAQGEALLIADQVTYFKNRDVVVAQGNVSMLQPTGDVYFAERAELKNDMKSGIINAFRARLSDNSVFAANEAKQVNASLTKLKKVAYTPCDVCETMAPFWQINAHDATVDQGIERIQYHDAKLEMFGVPILYTPYLSHPTPDASPKSGLLTPQYKTSANLGTLVKVPYYWRISPDKEAFITPWYSSTEGLLMEQDYRQLTDSGDYRFRASQTYPDKLNAAGEKVPGNEFRGHIYAQGQEELSEYSRVGFDVNRTTDDTYLRRYGFGAQNTLFSKAYVEAAQNRNYALGQGLLIQGLRLQDNPRTTPAVLPMLQGYYETEPTGTGLRYHVSGDAQSITRRQGVDQQRLSVTPGATLPLVTDNGQIFTTSVSLRQDVYNSSEVPITGSTQQFSGSTMRTLPQAAVEWRYPLMQQFGKETMTIEPLILAIAQTSGGNPSSIANEDNRLLELTDTNLFSLNRMPGLDTVDSGSRLAYGLRSQYLFSQYAALDALFGQNYNVESTTPFPNSIRNGENFSDYIGRIGLTNAPYTLAYRFSLNNTDMKPNRNEFLASYADIKGYAIAASYNALDKNRFVSDSEEALISGTLPFSDEWSIYGTTQRDLQRDIPVFSRGGIIYKNECFNIVVDALRTYTRDRDIEANTQFTLRVGFKNLGEFGGQ
jgi:LPS-assembly protein